MEGGKKSRCLVGIAVAEDSEGEGKCGTKRMGWRGGGRPGGAAADWPPRRGWPRAETWFQSCSAPQPFCSANPSNTLRDLPHLLFGQLRAVEKGWGGHSPELLGRKGWTKHETNNTHAPQKETWQVMQPQTKKQKGSA